MIVSKEPPQRHSQAKSCASDAAGDPIRFVIARGAANRWIVMETHGLYGGVFVSKEAAVRFADSESGDRNATLEFIREHPKFLEQGNGKNHSPA